MEKSLLQFYREHEKEIFDDLKEFVLAEGSSAETELLEGVRDVLIRIILKRTGIQPEVIPTEGRHDLVTFTYGENPGKVVVVGHYDTVHSAGSFEMSRKEGKIYGPGIYDMKGGIISSIWMVKAYRELGINPGKRIVFIYNGDEETGSMESKDVIDEIAKDAKAAVVCEPCIVSGDLKTGRKGGFSIKVELTGVASHAGNEHHLGRSAIEEMAREIQFIHSLTNYEIGTTLNVGICTGGTAANIVAEHASFEVDGRVCTQTEAKRVMDMILQYQTTVPGVTRTAIVLHSRPAMEETERNMELFTLAQECGKKLGLHFTHQFVGGGSDGNHIAGMGIPVLDSMGLHGDGAHTKTEYIFVDQVLPRMAMLASTIARI